MFWENFAKICKDKGIKPNPCAAAIGISSATVTKWKKGAVPNGETLLKLSQYLNCSVDYLLGNTAEKEKPAAEGDELDAERQFWLDLYDNASDEQISQIINYAKYLMQQNQDK